ncbi:MAG: acyl-CoA desaturase [Leptospirales bacterium]|nr:acyl-CoA desaturase [Leptospirales bacterium]
MSQATASAPSRFAIHLRKGTISLAALPFLLLQLSVLFVFTTYFSWQGLALCLAMWLVRQLAITAGYHRYFSHKTYKMGRPAQFLMALIGASAAQKGPLWWAAKHRHHHGYSDREEDHHSPRHGFWHSHWLWFLYDESRDYDQKRIIDFARYPEIRLIDRLWYLPPVLLALGLFAAGGWHAVVWGFFVSTFLLSNLTYSINSLCHVWGRQRYYSEDTSRNNFVLALLLLGEGWHNNHHKYQAAARNGFYWWEVDFSFYFIKLLSMVGLAWDLKQAPQKIIDEGRANDRARRGARRLGLKWKPPLPERSGRRTGLAEA